MIRDPQSHDLLVKTVRRFVRETMLPAEAEVERTNAIPPFVLSQMQDLGFFGLSIPEDFGGLGLTLEEEVLIAFELGYAAPAFRSAIGTNNGIGSQGLILHGTDAQKAFWLPKLASGEVIASFAMTEPDIGSDAASLRTSAVLDGDYYRLNGTKRYITNAPVAGLFTLLARTGGEGKDGISAFLVEPSDAGVSIGPPDIKMGQRGTLTADVILRDCRIKADRIVGLVPGRGFEMAMNVLSRGRLTIASICVGAARRLIDEAVSYAKSRQQFGTRIGDHQLVQAMLADSEAEAYAGATMVLDAARRFDLGERVRRQVSCAKLFCSEMVGRVADRAVQIHGGAGYMNAYPVERFYRDVRLFRIYEGTSQIQQLVIARDMLTD